MKQSVELTIITVLLRKICVIRENLLTGLTRFTGFLENLLIL